MTHNTAMRRNVDVLKATPTTSIVFSSSVVPAPVENTVFWLGEWDRQTDRRTDKSFA